MNNESVCTIAVLVGVIGLVSIHGFTKGFTICGGYGGVSCDHNGVPFVNKGAELEYVAQRKARDILYAKALKRRTQEIVNEGDKK
jgi:hypothetical protein